MQFEKILSELVNNSINSSDYDMLQKFVDKLTFGIYIRDFESFNFILVNEKLASILGYKKNELVGTNLFMQNTTSISYNDNLIIKLKQSTDKLQKVKIKNRNGELITLLHSFNIIQDINQKYYSVGVLIAANSIEDKKTISAFTKNFDFEEIFEQIQVPTAFVNNKLKQIIYANSAFKKYLKVTKNDNFLDLLNSVCFKNDYFRNNYDIFSTENLDYFEFYINILDYENNSNPSLCILNQLSDMEFDLLFMHPVVSENVNIQNLITTQRTEEISEKLIKSNFLTLVSHEFRTPLTKILLSADLLMNYDDKMNPDEKVARLNDIKDTIYGMTKLMEAVMTISRMEQDLFKAEFEFIDLRVFFEMILDGFMVRNNKGIYYNFHFESVYRFVSIEMTLMTLICNNLIDNATKFSHPNSVIEIFVDIDNDHNLVLEVKDNGIGIPKNEIEMIFDSFFKASNNRNYEGYGLGLFIVKKSVELLKGSIFVDSEPDVGTAVRVVIPQHRQSK